MRRVDLAAVGQELQDDGGARQGDEQSQEHRDLPAVHDREPDRGRCQRREADLQQSRGGDLPRHLAQPPQRELDADREQQQDDADFRQGFHGVHVGDELEGVGAEQHPRHDEARQGREAHPVEHQDDEDRDAEDDGQVPEQVQLLHGCASRERGVRPTDYLRWAKSRYAASARATPLSTSWAMYNGSSPTEPRSAALAAVAAGVVVGVRPR